MKLPSGGWRLVQLLYPAGFAAGYVLISFAATPTPVSGVWRPLLVAVICAAVLAVVLALVFRRLALGSLVASVLVLGLSAPWLPLIVLGAGMLWLLLLRILRGRRGAQLPRMDVDRLARITGVVSAMFLVVSIATALPHVGTAGRSASTASVDADAANPDIVIVLLDGYPRSDVLHEGFSLDNRPFEEALARLGFDVKSESRSNYSATWATLASMMNGQYLEGLPGLEAFPEDQAEQYRALSRTIDGSSIPGLLRSHGYEMAWVASAFENASMTTADRVISGGQITAFELSLISDSLILPAVHSLAPDALLVQHRERTQHAFEQIAQLAQPDGRPVFAVVHVLSPHPPIIYDAGGSLPSPARCLPDCSLWALVDEEQWPLFPAQVAHVNELVIAAMTDAIAANPDAVLVVMSDHGTKPPDGAEESVLANFTAVRLPGGRDAVPNDVSPVNLLAEILNPTLGTDLPTHPYRGWISESEYPLRMEPAP